MLDLAVDHGFQLLVIDALELLAIVYEERRDDATAAPLRCATDFERSAVGYRFSMVPLSSTRTVVVGSSEQPWSLVQAVQLARGAESSAP